MKTAFLLLVVVAIIGMAMAAVHRYRIDANGNKVEVPVKDVSHHSEGLIEFAANGINKVGGAIGGAVEGLASGIFG